MPAHTLQLLTAADDEFERYLADKRQDEQRHPTNPNVRTVVPQGSPDWMYQLGAVSR